MNLHRLFHGVCDAWPASERNGIGGPVENRPLNRLAAEISPYLLQHAHNPVDWYP